MECITTGIYRHQDFSAGLTFPAILAFPCILSSLAFSGRRLSKTVETTCESRDFRLTPICTAKTSPKSWWHNKLAFTCYNVQMGGLYKTQNVHSTKVSLERVIQSRVPKFSKNLHQVRLQVLLSTVNCYKCHYFSPHISYYLDLLAFLNSLRTPKETKSRMLKMRKTSVIWFHSK